MASPQSKKNNSNNSYIIPFVTSLVCGKKIEIPLEGYVPPL
jgi:hypothetical protein